MDMFGYYEEKLRCLNSWEENRQYHTICRLDFQRFSCDYLVHMKIYSLFEHVV